jgi:hypothetical protein
LASNGSDKGTYDGSLKIGRSCDRQRTQPPRENPALFSDWWCQRRRSTRCISGASTHTRLHSHATQHAGRGQQGSQAGDTAENGQTRYVATEHTTHTHDTHYTRRHLAPSSGPFTLSACRAPCMCAYVSQPIHTRSYTHACAFAAHNGPCCILIPPIHSTHTRPSNPTTSQASPHARSVGTDPAPLHSKRFATISGQQLCCSASSRSRDWYV